MTTATLEKTLIIGDVEVRVRKDGDMRIIGARDRRTGHTGEPVRMTKEQCATLGDVLKVMAL
jgi:hypothetical protein